jgi:hypothetical protein
VVRETSSLSSKAAAARLAELLLAVGRLGGVAPPPIEE